MQLYPYQQDGVGFLADRQHALLADDMGLGKSAQAIRACDVVGATTVLVVCPASVRETWRREFAAFSETGLAPLVFSYDEVVRGKFGDADALQLDVLICDEAHYLKSRKAKRTKAIFGPKCAGGGLADRARHVWLLTGTPAPNNPAELWPMCRACFPDAIRASTGRIYDYWTFVSRYCVTFDNGFGIQIVRGKNLEKLRGAIEPHMLRRKKADVLTDLPPIRFADLPLDSAAARKAIRDQADSDEVEALLQELDKPEPALDAVAAHVASLRRITGLAKVAPVTDWVREAFDDGLDKIVLMAWHRDVIDALYDAFGTHGVVSVTGGTAAGDRQKVVDRFQTDPEVRIFIGQITAAGTGLTLTAASRMLFVESSWTPADNAQAAMRIHRIGQRDSVLVQFATLAGSIDERVMKVVRRKTADLEQLFA